MKNTTLVLSVCSLLGCALSSRAAVDITVNGNEYAVTTETGSYTSLAATLSGQPTVQASLGSGTAGIDTGTGFSQYFQYRSQAFATAYYNAVTADLAANIPNTPTLMDAQNTYFLTIVFSGASAGNVEVATLNQVSFQSASTSFTYAEVAPVAAPEPGAYGALAGAGLLAISLRRQLGRKMA